MENNTMSRDVFERELDRVQSNFKYFALSPEKIDIFYKKLGHIGLKALADIVDDIISNSRNSPVLQDFIDRIDTFGGVKQTRRNIEAKKIDQLLENKKLCKYCNQSGYVRAHKKQNFGFGEYNYSYVFKCFCDYGKARIDAFPVFSRKDVEDGYIPFCP
jgi:hypothetical protein